MNVVLPVGCEFQMYPVGVVTSDGGLFSEKLLLLFVFQFMLISIWVSLLEIAEFPDSVRRSAP